MLEEPDGKASYWIAGPNFYVITRYNRSRLYATAVIRLAEAIRAAR
jgi:membrane-bound lytic murein transglycosylase B